MPTECHGAGGQALEWRDLAFVTMRCGPNSYNHGSGAERPTLAMRVGPPVSRPESARPAALVMMACIASTMFMGLARAPERRSRLGVLIPGDDCRRKSGSSEAVGYPALA